MYSIWFNLISLYPIILFQSHHHCMFISSHHHRRCLSFVPPHRAPLRPFTPLHCANLTVFSRLVLMSLQLEISSKFSLIYERVLSLSCFDFGYFLAGRNQCTLAITMDRYLFYNKVQCNIRYSLLHYFSLFIRVFRFKLK